MNKLTERDFERMSYAKALNDAFDIAFQPTSPNITEIPSTEDNLKQFWTEGETT